MDAVLATVAWRMYLLLAYLKIRRAAYLSWSLHQMLRVRPARTCSTNADHLVELFTTPSPPGLPRPQMLLWR